MRVLTSLLTGLGAVILAQTGISQTPADDKADDAAGTETMLAATETGAAPILTPAETPVVEASSAPSPTTSRRSG